MSLSWYSLQTYKYMLFRKGNLSLLLCRFVFLIYEVTKIMLSQQVLKYGKYNLQIQHQY